MMAEVIKEPAQTPPIPSEDEPERQRRNSNAETTNDTLQRTTAREVSGNPNEAKYDRAPTTGRKTDGQRNKKNLMSEQLQEAHSTSEQHTKEQPRKEQHTEEQPTGETM